MKKVLITGGPVHAYLDAVKIITNRFKGGLMCQLAEALLAYDTKIVYLCAPSVGAEVPPASERLEVVHHKGFDDYLRKVTEIAPLADAVILGAAVANLIPAKPYVGKFPSHNYKPGDLIPIDFTIAPRVIDLVKKVAPKTQLFGYKLLAGVAHEELIEAAYGIVLEARATAVFANDAKDLQQKYAVTKERGVHPLRQEDLAPWIWEMLHDMYYTTVLGGPSKETFADVTHASFLVGTLIEQNTERFLTTASGLIFGTVAARCGDGFVTTGRGKRELDSVARVLRVDHETRTVSVSDGKASLNAPLLARMFENPRVESIVHYHQEAQGLPTYPYAPPGSVRDTDRPNTTSFNIKEHGCMLLFDKDGRQL